MLAFIIIFNGMYLPFSYACYLPHYQIGVVPYIILYNLLFHLAIYHK